MRLICEIAADIRKHWKNVYFGAAPYLEAMRHLTTLDSKYGEDDCKYILTYFLGNAATFRGPEARRIKAELQSMLKG